MTMTDATQTGVSDDNKTTTEPKEARPTERELAMEAISVHRESSDAIQPEPVVDQVAAQTQFLSDGLDRMMVKVKIDGVERDVTVEEMQRQYQKNGAAERRLEEATRLLNDARAHAAPPVGFAPNADQDDITQTPGGDPDEVGKAFLAALFDGDEGKALEALKKIGTGRQQPTRDDSELVAQLTPAIKQQLVVESALERFAVDYADVVKDPYLAQMADGFLEADVQGGKPFTEALESAGRKTRDWLTSKGVTTPNPTPTMDRNTKLERKAGIDQIPALNTKATTIEAPVQSATDVINEMRKARGLAI